MYIVSVEWFQEKYDRRWDPSGENPSSHPKASEVVRMMRGSR